MADSREGRAQADEGAARFRRLMIETTPPDAVVLVVTKGDHNLLDLGDREGWHFPQRSDGVYAGFHPHDAEAAITHLEALRERGGQFLAFPQTSAWWLEHYTGLADHLEERYELVAEDAEAGILFRLDGPEVSPAAPENGDAAGSSRGPEELITADLDGPRGDELRLLFRRPHYEKQASQTFESSEEALLHYLEEGFRLGFDPHPLFSTNWYRREYLEDNPEQNPLVHYLERSGEEDQDPNPYFDNWYYYSLVPALREDRVNALLHYTRTASKNQSSHPNPLFRDGFYLRTYGDGLGDSETPLEHYLSVGSREGRYTSELHQTIVNDSQRSSSGLIRGNWTRASILYLLRGGDAPTTEQIERLSEALEAEHHLGAVRIALSRPLTHSHGADEDLLVLGDYQPAADVLRPSAVRLLARGMTALGSVLAITDAPIALEPLHEAGVPTYAFPPRNPGGRGDRLIQALDHARRVLVPSSEAFLALGRTCNRFPVNAALFPGSEPETTRLLELAGRDLGLALEPAERSERPAEPTRRILVLCSDWSVSGVNASLEAIGGELRRRDWDVEILFTRDEAYVRDTGEGGSHVPRLPYRFLSPAKPGLTGMWEALISELQAASPCIVFMAYDFIANAVVSALTDEVGAVIWMQADDGDYYEQAYRLGPYCNALVCVSQHIRDHVTALNPALGERAHVVHNSSVRSSDVLSKRPRRRSKLRLVYTGRLVQYQKRVLDYIPLADALDELGVPYEIDLIGSFSAYDTTEASFLALSKAHRENGRIRLLGRKNRDEIFAELAAHDFFVLLSEFEGLPLALGEAMACGCVPVVASSPSGIPEIVTTGENGFIMETRDYSEWAELMVDLWNHPRRLSKLSKNARATVSDQFTVERVGADMDAVFSQVAEECHVSARARPAPLHWGSERSPAGDVLPPPSLIRPSLLRLPGLA